MSQVKNQPATPLPFSLEEVRPEPTHMYATIRGSDRTIPIRVSGPNASQDATYVVIAANAYPKLVEALRALNAICDNVPVFQLDEGKASVKAVRLAGKFMDATRNASALLRELCEQA